MDARDAHDVLELGFARLQLARDRRGRQRDRCRWPAECALRRPTSRWSGSSPTQPAPGKYTSHQACKSVKSCSAPAGPFERLDVGLELNQIARDESRGQSQLAQDLHQQPGRIAARAAAALQASPPAFARPAPCRIRYSISWFSRWIQIHQKIDRADFAHDRSNRPMPQQRARLLAAPETARCRGSARRRSWNGILFGLGLEEEIERIDHRHFGDQIDDDPEVRHLFRET